ncbi:MAG: hypothetical protein ACNS61_11935 [Candidatus Wenzhouxiangella sp. M2_3B_020]
MTDDSALGLGDAIRFPLRADVRNWLFAVIGAGALIELLVLLPIPFTGLVAFVLRILLWVMVYRVASEILLGSAEGDTGAPGTRSVESADGLAVRHIGLWLIATLLLAVLVIHTGPIGVVAGSAAIALVLPAATVILTLSRSLVEALIPTQWLRLAARIGYRDYARLFAVLMAAALVYLGLNAALSVVDAGRGARNVIRLGYWSFAVFGWFHLAGRAVFFHRAELNPIEPDTEAPSRPERFTRDPEQLWRQIRQRGGTRQMHAELARLLERSGARETRLLHAQMHLEALLYSFEKPGEAVDRADRMLSLDPDFCLERPQSMRALIAAARSQEADRLAGRLCGNYLERFPDSGKADEIRLTGCEALADDASSLGERAQRWFRELMTADLDETQRARLNALAPVYLSSEPT